MGQVPRHRADGLLQGPGGQPVRHPRLQLSHAHGRAEAAGSLCSTTANTPRSPVREVPQDPLKFRDGKRYTDRLKTPRTRPISRTPCSSPRARSKGRTSSPPRRTSASWPARSAWPPARPSSPACCARWRSAPVHPVRGLGRSAHAGGHPLAHADAAHHDCRAEAARGASALSRRAHRPDHRRRHGLLRHAGRRAHRRARRAHLFRRSARHSADHPRAAARGLPEGRVPAGARHDRHGRASPQAARDAGPAVPALHRQRGGGARGKADRRQGGRLPQRQRGRRPDHRDAGPPSRRDRRRTPSTRRALRGARAHPRRRQVPHQPCSRDSAA